MREWMLNSKHLILSTHLLECQFKFPSVTVFVVFPVQDNFHGVFDDIMTQLLGDLCGSAHSWGRVDLNQPGMEVFRQHKVCPVQLKGVLEHKVRMFHLSELDHFRPVSNIGGSPCYVGRFSGSTAWFQKTG